MNTLLKKLYAESLESMAERRRKSREYQRCLVRYQRQARTFYARLTPELRAHYERMNGREDEILEMMEFGAFAAGFRAGARMEKKKSHEREP